MPIMREILRSLLLPTIATALIFTTPRVSGAESSDVRKYYLDAIDYFHQFNLIPVLIPRRQEVGSVYDARQLRFLYETNECFPTLKVPAKAPSGLALYHSSTNANLEGILGLPAMAAAEAKASYRRITHISYVNVQVQTVSEAALRRAYSQKRCSELAPLVTGKTVSGGNLADSYLIVGEVYFAKRQIEFEISGDADVTASANGLVNFLRSKGINVRAEARTGGLGARKVVLSTEDIVPVAIRPAFIPLALSGVVMGAGDHHDKQRVKWAPFSRHPTASQALAFDEVIEQMKEKIANDDPQ